MPELILFCSRPALVNLDVCHSLTQLLLVSPAINL
jgi:hypothetical protein